MAVIIYYYDFLSFRQVAPRASPKEAEAPAAAPELQDPEAPDCVQVQDPVQDTASSPAGPQQPAEDSQASMWKRRTAAWRWLVDVVIYATGNSGSGSGSGVRPVLVRRRLSICQYQRRRLRGLADRTGAG